MNRSSKRFRITLNAPVTLVFVALCAVATVAGVVTGGVANQLLFSTYRTSIFDPFFYLRLFTHVLGHSGVSHFVSNAIYLLLLGPILEEKYGSSTMACVIAITALVTGLVHALLVPGSALLGASGICFAFIIMSSITNVREGEIPLTFILVFVFFVGQQVFDAFTTINHISYLTHIVGGIVGGLCGFALARGRRKRA